MPSPSKTVAIFLDEAPPKSALDGIKGANREEVRLGKREFYVHYPDGQGRSKLKIPGAAAGTARNMNTIAKLVEMAGDSQSPASCVPGRTRGLDPDQVQRGRAGVFPAVVPCPIRPGKIPDSLASAREPGSASGNAAC